MNLGTYLLTPSVIILWSNLDIINKIKVFLVQGVDFLTRCYSLGAGSMRIIFREYSSLDISERDAMSRLGYCGTGLNTPQSLYNTG